MDQSLTREESYGRTRQALKRSEGAPQSVEPGITEAHQAEKQERRPEANAITEQAGEEASVTHY